jgi:hypothetical protein
VDHILGYFSTPRRKFVTSFALGLVTGIILFTVILFTSNYHNLSEPKDIVGTMGLHETETFKSINISTKGVAGRFDITKLSNHFEFNVNLKSSEKYTLQIEFNPSDLKIENLSLANLSNIKIEKNPGAIKIIGADTLPYTLLFLAKELTPQKVLLKILQNDNKLFEQEISLSNN